MSEENAAAAGMEATETVMEEQLQTIEAIDDEIDSAAEAEKEDEGPGSSDEDARPESDTDDDAEDEFLTGEFDEPDEAGSPEPEPIEQIELELATGEKPVRSIADLSGAVETLIFVSEEPLSVKALSDILDEDKRVIQSALEALADEFNTREGGLQLREIAGGWQFSTRPQYHEDIRKFLRTRPSAKLSIASLETLAVIAYKQPVTVPEIMEIRGVQSPSAIKTLLDKRLIVAKGRKETVGKPMMYGTSKDFLIQFGLKDLTELPSIEDFEDLVS
jgi:segregation and condensation protein B